MDDATRVNVRPEGAIPAWLDVKAVFPDPSLVGRLEALAAAWSDEADRLGELIARTKAAHHEYGQSLGRAELYEHAELVGILHAYSGWDAFHAAVINLADRILDAVEQERP